MPRLLVDAEGNTTHLGARRQSLHAISQVELIMHADYSKDVEAQDETHLQRLKQADI